MLPKIDIGDLIYSHDTGAHGSAMGYNYNGKLRSAEVQRCKVVTGGLGAADEAVRAVLAEQDLGAAEPVSYTHLDVYKRQPRGRA